MTLQHGKKKLSVVSIGGFTAHRISHVWGMVTCMYWI